MIHDREGRIRFLDRLWDSEPARWSVARWLSSRGYTISLAPAMFPGDCGDRLMGPDFDRGDIYIVERVEVKGLSRHFSSPDDWPFKDFIVTSRYQFETQLQTWGLPLMYAAVNSTQTHVAVVMTRNWKEWKIDTRNGNDWTLPKKEYYIASKDEVQFFPLICEKPDWSQPLGDLTL